MAEKGGMTVELMGADDVLKAVQTLPREIRRMANREFRDASRDIAYRMAAQIATGRYARGAPQAYKVSRTARAKRDRLPVVKIPATRIGLSGQSGRSASGRRVKYRRRALAGGHEDRRIAWAATGGSPGNPHFPGSTNWIKGVRGDAKELGVQQWRDAAAAIMARYGLL